MKMKQYFSTVRWMPLLALAMVCAWPDLVSAAESTSKPTPPKRVISPVARGMVMDNVRFNTVDGEPIRTP